MAEATKAAPKSDPSEFGREAQAHTGKPQVPNGEPPARTIPRETAPTYRLCAKDGKSVHLCGPAYKPPGTIADHDTPAVGVWVETSIGWRKTGKSPNRAFNTIRASKTDLEAIATLLASA